jgi:hypothetical protein
LYKIDIYRILCFLLTKYYGSTADEVLHLEGLSVGLGGSFAFFIPPWGTQVTWHCSGEIKKAQRWVYLSQFLNAYIIRDAKLLPRLCLFDQAHAT